MSTPTEFTRPPPDYSTASTSDSAKKPAATNAYGSTIDRDARKPLLQPGEGAAPRDAWNEAGDLEDDFEIGVNLSQSSQDVRNDFVRKVYSVLFFQILATTIVGWIMAADKIAAWTFQHPGFALLTTVGAIASMIGVHIKHRSSPANVLLLGAFTLFEAVTVGFILPAYNPDTLLKALLITTFTFLGLTLFTFQTKWDIMSWAPYLSAVLLAFFITSMVSIFLPFSSTFDLAMAGFGCLLFSAWIVFDTHVLLKYMHPDQWALACIRLYLDILNLFLQILRILSDIQDR